jgi:hypothetical protein
VVTLRSTALFAEFRPQHLWVFYAGTNARDHGVAGSSLHTTTFHLTALPLPSRMSTLTTVRALPHISGRVTTVCVCVWLTSTIRLLPTVSPHRDYDSGFGHDVLASLGMLPGHAITGGQISVPHLRSRITVLQDCLDIALCSHDHDAHLADTTMMEDMGIGIDYDLH